MVVNGWWQFRDEEKETKRDWKEEKKSETTGEPAEQAEQDSEANKPKKETPKVGREGRYTGVKTNLLHCFVCGKTMWDGESFQNHLRGKAHKQMMDALEETFQITVNILRENMRVVEEKKMIEFERMARMSRGHQKHPKIEPQSHCNMCDLKFMGKIMGHRKTEGHQRLKRFLHPKCRHCNLEFPSRMEWIDHRFSPEHLRRLGDVLGNRNGQQDGADIVKEDDIEINIDPLLDESLQTEAADPILELTDDLRDLHNRIPAYKPTRPIATASMTPISGFYCEVCDKFLTSEPVSQVQLYLTPKLSRWLNIVFIVAGTFEDWKALLRICSCC